MGNGFGNQISFEIKRKIFEPLYCSVHYIGSLHFLTAVIRKRNSVSSKIKGVDNNKIAEKVKLIVL